MYKKSKWSQWSEAFSGKTPKIMIPNMVVFLFLLVGCSAQTDDLQTWTEMIRKNGVPTPEKLPATVVYPSFKEDQFSEVDPFLSDRLFALLDLSDQKDKEAPPEVRKDRIREFLEGFPLDSIKMVGSLRDKKGTRALVQVGGRIYSLAAGSFMGKDSGVVTKIEQDFIVIKEFFSDVSGKWSTRESIIKIESDSNKNISR